MKEKKYEELTDVVSVLWCHGALCVISKPKGRDGRFHATVFETTGNSILLSHSEMKKVVAKALGEARAFLKRRNDKVVFQRVLKAALDEL